MSGGGVLNLDGIALYSYRTRGNVEISYDDYLPVEFCGALGAMLLTVSTYMYYDECNVRKCTVCVIFLVD